MATTTFTTMIPTPQTKKAGPPVPPRPQQSNFFKTQQQRDASSSSPSSSLPSSLSVTAATTTATTTTSQRLMSKVGLEQPHILKKPVIVNANNSNSNANTNTPLTSLSSSVTTSGGRTVIYKSPTLNLQQRREEREKCTEANTQTSTTAITRTTSTATTAAKTILTTGTTAPRPPLKLRKAPDVPTNKPRTTTTTPPTTPVSSPVTTSTTLQAAVKENETNTNGNNNNDNNNIVIVQSSQGVVTLNRHHSMGAGSPQSKSAALLKDTRLSLGKVDFERAGKIQVQQLLPTTQPLPKPRKIVKVPVATLDVDDHNSTSTTTTSTNTLHVNLFKRSKTSIENFTSRSNITTVNTTTGSYLSGKTVEIKNNLKNAAERLFSEIMVNQQKQNGAEAANTIITKHERAIQHQANNEVTVVTTSKDYAALNTDNCTRINITTNTNSDNKLTAANATVTTASTNFGTPRQMVSAFNSPEKKPAAFHEMLISELAAMRSRSCSMENLQTKQMQPLSPLVVKDTAIDKPFPNYKQLHTLENQLKGSSHSNNANKQRQDHHHHHHAAADDDIDADNVEDADGDMEEDLKKSLKVITSQNSPRKRTPSGCSSDSSPYGTERSARIRTSDWIEVGDNGKQVTLTSCHISLEDSGLEDEERMDEMSSSGVGDSWDSVKEAEEQQQMQQQKQQQQQQQQQLQQQSKRNRNIKRIMSISDLPPLPKSLSGINKMLASDSGLVSDVDIDTTTITTTAATQNDLNDYENQKENNKNLNINNNNNNNNNNSSAHKNATDKLNNGSVTTATPSTSTATIASAAAVTTMTTTAMTATPLKEINGNETISEIPPAIPGSKLDTQIATLRKEMFGLRQLDLSLLSQLWALNDSIQEFRTMIQDHEPDDDETYSTHSRSPSPYDSVSSDAEDETLTLKSKKLMELQNGHVITTQPKLTKSYSAENDSPNQSTTINSISSLSSSTSTSTASPTVSAITEQKSQLMKPPLPKPLDIKPVPRMRSAPPPPPTHRKSQTAPPRPT